MSAPETTNSPSPTTGQPPPAAGARNPAWPPSSEPVLELRRWNPSVAAVPLDEPDRPPLRESDSSAMVYEIDGDGLLQYVSDAWDRFALANGAPDLRRRNVLGRPFWAFFDGDDTIAEHEAILSRCETRQQQGTFLFRCDAPFERRLLRMTVDPLQAGGFRFTSRTVAVQGRSGQVYEHLFRIAPAPEVARCCQCNRFRWNREWLEPEHAIQVELDDDGITTKSRMIHTLCPECRASMRAVPRLVG